MEVANFGAAIDTLIDEDAKQEKNRYVIDLLFSELS